MNLVTDKKSIKIKTDELLEVLGLTEVRNSAGEEFGEDKLLDFLSKNATEGAKELNTKLLNHIEAFRGREPWPDDITVLTCKVFC